MLQKEEVLKDRINSKNRDIFEKYINLMQDRKLIQIRDNKITFKSASETFNLFASSLVWPMIDSYYITLLFSLSMVKNKGVEIS